MPIFCDNQSNAGGCEVRLCSRARLLFRHRLDMKIVMWMVEQMVVADRSSADRQFGRTVDRVLDLAWPVQTSRLLRRVRRGPTQCAGVCLHRKYHGVCTGRVGGRAMV